VSAATDRALVADKYEPKRLAEVISADGAPHLHRVTEGWIRTVLREGLRCKPPANVRLLISRRDARTMWVYADEWYNRVNRPQYGVWLDENRHLRPKLIYGMTKAMVRSTRPRPEHKQQPTADLTPDIAEYIDRRVEAVVAAAVERFPTPKPKRKQITDEDGGRIIAYISPIRRKVAKQINSAVHVRVQMTGQDTSEVSRDLWVWLRIDFEQAVGGIDEEVYRGQLEEGSWLGGIESAGYLELFVGYLPRMIARWNDEFYSKQKELF